MNECESGHALTGTFSPIRILLQDDEGVPLLDSEGELLYTQLRLPDHVWRMPGNERDPDTKLANGDIRPSRWEADERGHRPSEFDPTGLVMTFCGHGLPPDQHPLGRAPYPRSGLSWLRSRYATTDMRCVVDHGQERPADLTTPREA